MRLVALITSAAVLLLILAGVITMAVTGAGANSPQSAFGGAVCTSPFVAYFLSVVRPTPGRLRVAKVLNWLALVFLAGVLTTLTISSIGLSSNPRGIIGVSVLIGVPLILNLIALHGAARRHRDPTPSTDARQEMPRAG